MKIKDRIQAEVRNILKSEQQTDKRLRKPDKELLNDFKQEVYEWGNTIAPLNRYGTFTTNYSSGDVLKTFTEVAKIKFNVSQYRDIPADQFEDLVFLFEDYKKLFQEE